MKIRSLLQGKKRYLAAAVVAASLGGGAYAFAAGLNVSSSTLSSGSAVVASCGDTLSVTYGTAYDATIPGYRVTDAYVTGATTNNCAGKAATLELTGPTAGAALSGSSSSPITLTTGTNDFVIGGDVPAASVTGVAIVVTG
jgi:hypothetical protein